MKNGFNLALALHDLKETGREIMAGGPGSGRHKTGEDASTKEEHLAAAKHHNERAEIYLQHKGQAAQDLAFDHMKAAQAHENAARLGTARHTQWAQRASGAANGAEDAYPKAVAAGAKTKLQKLYERRPNLKAKHAGGIHTIIEKFKIKPELVKNGKQVR